jgi:hypothetical protein
VKKDELSYIVPARDIGKMLESGSIEDLTAFTQQPFGPIVEAVTGGLSLGKWGLAAVGGRLVQGILKGHCFKQFAIELKSLIQKGKIDPDFANKKYGFQTWVELLTAIDSDITDEDRLNALKAMFLATNKVNASDADRIVGYQLFQIAKRLSSNDLLVLKAIFQLHSHGTYANTGYQAWAVAVAKELGHGVTGLVGHAEAALLNNSLISDRSYSDRSGIQSANARLTDLGQKFCTNIEQYHREA